MSLGLTRKFLPQLSKFKPKLAVPFSRSLSNLESDDTQRKPKRPDLRKAATGESKTVSRIIVAACLLVTIYLYPMIFKPLFNIGNLGKC